MKKPLRNGSSSLVHWRDYTDDKRKNPYRGIRGGLAPPSWYKIMTGPLGQHHIKNTEIGTAMISCTVHWRFFFCFSKKRPTSEEPNVQMVTNTWLLEEMPSFWWGKGAIPKHRVSGFFFVRFVFLSSSSEVVSFPGNAGSHWSAHLNWPVVIRAVTRQEACAFF